MEINLTAVFTTEERNQIRGELLERARADQRLGGGAITGSAACESEDRWSDMDLAFGVADGSDLNDVVPDWTAHMYEKYRAVHHLEIRANE